MKKWFQRAIHNMIAHPMMMFLPRKWGARLHDRTAIWAGYRENQDE